jgi:hypothetical protein
MDDLPRVRAKVRRFVSRISYVYQTDGSREYVSNKEKDSRTGENAASRI